MKTLYLIIILFTTSSCASKYVNTGTGLQYVILKKGKGDNAEIGDELLLYETTSYRNGPVFYSNENSGNPIKIKIGAGQVTNAVDKGLQGMRP